MRYSLLNAESKLRTVPIPSHPPHPSAVEESIDIASGNPQRLLPEKIVNILQKHMVPNSAQSYAYTSAHPPALEAIAKHMERIHSLPYTPNDVVLVGGAVSGMANTFMALCNPGEEVIVLTPSWPPYPAQILMASCTPVLVPLTEPDFDLDLKAIEKAITPLTRMIVINSPCNPTGRIYSAEQLKKLSEILQNAQKMHKRAIFVLSDEAYRDILFTPHKYFPVASFYDNTVSSYTFAKTHLMPGIRLGYITISPKMAPELHEAVKRAYTTVLTLQWNFPSAPLQYALPELLELPVYDLDQVQERRDLAVKTFTEYGYEVTAPEGTFYFLIKCPIANDLAFCDLMANKYRVVVLPVRQFHSTGYFRISLLAPIEKIRKALPAFKHVLTSEELAKLKQSKL